MLSVRPQTAVFLCLFLFGFNVNAIAQATGTVSGRVVDQSGGVLPGVAVDLVVNSRELTTATDGVGAYRFDGVPAGDAELTFRLLNFSVLRRSVPVAGGASVTVDAVLTLSLSADVIVTLAPGSSRAGSLQSLRRRGVRHRLLLCLAIGR